MEGFILLSHCLKQISFKIKIVKPLRLLENQCDYLISYCLCSNLDWRLASSLILVLRRPYWEDLSSLLCLSINYCSRSVLILSPHEFYMRQLTLIETLGVNEPRCGFVSIFKLLLLNKKTQNSKIIIVLDDILILRISYVYDMLWI